MTIQANSHIKRNEDIVCSQIDNEVVMMSLELGKYYGLDPIASHIWQLLETPQSVATLCQSLLLEYDVNKQNCLHDVTKLLEDLEDNNLIQVSN